MLETAFPIYDGKVVDLDKAEVVEIERIIDDTLTEHAHRLS